MLVVWFLWLLFVCQFGPPASAALDALAPIHSLPPDSWTASGDPFSLGEIALSGSQGTD